ncbi:hypothetical protein OHR68_36085 [Spirillospora sp. NBC_00431]
MTDKYGNDRKALRMYAKDVGAQSPLWDQSAHRLKAAYIDDIAFTRDGDRIAAAYKQLVTDYSWYAWRIGVTLHKVEQALNETAMNYGKAEAKSEDDITKVGEQF